MKKLAITALLCSSLFASSAMAQNAHERGHDGLYDELLTFLSNSKGSVQLYNPKAEDSLRKLLDQAGFDIRDKNGMLLATKTGKDGIIIKIMCNKKHDKCVLSNVSDKERGHGKVSTF